MLKQCWFLFLENTFKGSSPVLKTYEVQCKIIFHRVSNIFNMGFCCPLSHLIMYLQKDGSKGLAPHMHRLNYTVFPNIVILHFSKYCYLAFLKCSSFAAQNELLSDKKRTITFYQKSSHVLVIFLEFNNSFQKIIVRAKKAFVLMQ